MGSAQAQLRVAFDADIPYARWGPLFHVFHLEQPGVTVQWRPVGFPAPGRSLLDNADAGVFLHPPSEDGLRALTLDTSPMVVVVAAGHPLAQHDRLTVADVLDEPFPGGANPHPEWTAFWTLDEQRGGPPRLTEDDIGSSAQGIDVVASRRAIVTLPTWAAAGLAHPGVVALPLSDGPRVTTCLVWRADDDSPLVLGLVDLTVAWTSDRRTNGAPDPGHL
ncbi:MAG TPA: LysR family substrate-binding domain-containing protein [Gaiellales bacterium]|jgi:DNA-binding transcriptional LysR family regulator|nr:LysR family substrate-binding domain-containing protein [Gaiellales bacterium]